MVSGVPASEAVSNAAKWSMELVGPRWSSRFAFVTLMSSISWLMVWSRVVEKKEVETKCKVVWSAMGYHLNAHSPHFAKAKRFGKPALLWLPRTSEYCRTGLLAIVCRALTRCAETKSRIHMTDWPILGGSTLMPNMPSVFILCTVSSGSLPMFACLRKGTGRLYTRGPGPSGRIPCHA